jgi:hypothetical protein
MPTFGSIIEAREDGAAMRGPWKDAHQLWQ